LFEIYISSNSRNLSQFLTKGKGGKSDRKIYPLPYGLRNPYRNLNSENSQDNAQKPQRDCTFMNSPFVLFTLQPFRLAKQFVSYIVLVSGEALSAKQAANTAAAIFSLVGMAAAMALAFSWI
jgi:hypothetical protein